jgi:hypothetical protein
VKTPKTADTIAHFLKELERPARELTEWELGFLADISDQFEQWRTLTDRQFEVLEGIYAAKTE